MYKKLSQNPSACLEKEKPCAQMCAVSNVTLDDVVNEIADIGFGRKFLQEMDKQGEIILAPPSASIVLKALELLGKSLGMFDDKQSESESELEVTIKVINGDEA